MELQRFGEHRKMQWANGLGVTYEVAAFPETNEWDWRLSIAEVTVDGPFSVLPGIDRVLVVATGNGLTLRVDGQERVVNRFGATSFSGDATTTCELTNAPVHDVNLMVRRNRGFDTANIEIKLLDRNDSVEQPDIESCLAIVVLEGAIVMSTPGDGFPFNPVKVRASRLDAFLPTTMPSSKRPTLYAATQSVIAIASIDTLVG